MSEPSYRVRRLTPLEAWRLMGFSDDEYFASRDAMNTYCYHGKDRSASQLYKQAGNSIVVPVLLQIMQNLYAVMPYLFQDMRIGSFFSGIGAFEKALTMLNCVSIPTGTSGQLDPTLNQVAHIGAGNHENFRVYDTNIATTIKAVGGGGGAKSGWYKVKSQSSQ